MQPLSIEATWVDDRGRAGYAFSTMSGRLWHYANSDGVPKRPLIVALAVGTILNPINQGDALVGGAALNVATLLPAYGVPFCVGTCGAVSYRLHAAGGERAVAATLVAISASLGDRHLRDGAWWGATGQRPSGGSATSVEPERCGER